VSEEHCDCGRQSLRASARARRRSTDVTQICVNPPWDAPDATQGCRPGPHPVPTWIPPERARESSELCR
jgi:hypothetical protein